MILLDPPRWPAHGTLFGHLVSDTSLAELHAFARTTGLPAGAFDHDHYDVPERRYDALTAAGAVLTTSRTMVQRLEDAGLRVRPRDRQPGRRRALASVVARWEADPPASSAVRDALLTRWQEPHRRYHDIRHLEQCLSALESLGGTSDSLVTLALWFHDAIHTGTAGDDEDASADLVAELLRGNHHADDIAEIQRLVRLTRHHDPDPGDLRGALVTDADLSILAVSEARYHVYARDVRLEYQHVPDAAFVAGRLDVMRGLMARPSLFRSPTGRDLEESARRNVTAELDQLATGLPLVPGGAQFG